MDQQIADLKSLLSRIMAKGGLDAPMLNEACRLLEVPLSGDLSEAQGMALGRMLMAFKDEPQEVVIAA